MVSLLKCFHWSDVEKPLYYKAASAGLQLLSLMVSFPHLARHKLASSVAGSLGIARGLSTNTIPKELLELVTSLTLGMVSIALSHCIAIYLYTVYTCHYVIVYITLFTSVHPPQFPVLPPPAVSSGFSTRSTSCHPSESDRLSTSLSDDELELSEGSGESLTDSGGSQNTSRAH